MVKRFVPPPTDAERALDKQAAEFLRRSGYDTNGAPLDARRKGRGNRRPPIIYTPTGGQPGGRRRR